MKNLILLVVTFLMFSGCQSSDTLNNSIKNEITQSIDSINNEIILAFNNHDVAKILSYIDQSNDLRYVEHIQVTIGWNNLKNGFEKWHPENSDLSIKIDQSYVNVLSSNIAVLINKGKVYKSGKEHQQLTWTAVFQKKSEDWKIVNAHETFQ